MDLMTNEKLQYSMLKPSGSEFGSGILQDHVKYFSK